MANVELNIHVQIAELQKGLKEVKQGQKDLAAQSAKTSKIMQSNMQQTGQVANQLKGTLTGLFAVGTAVQLAKSIINIRAEFEKYEAVLRVALGSAEAANREFDKIKRFASETPFSVKGLTEAFVKLTSFGLKPTIKQMRAMGDLAAATGQDFLQLAQAVTSAATGEFDMLKQFNIKAQKQGNEVKLRFQDLTRTVEFTETAIRDAIVEFGQMEGVQGSMAEISKTLGGQISNMNDSIIVLADKLGELGSSEVSSGITVLKSLADIMSSLMELKPNLDTDKGVLGFLSKVSDGLKIFLSVSTGGAVAGSTFRKLFAGALEGLSEELAAAVDNTENLSAEEEDIVKVEEVQVETLEKLKKKLKILNEEKQKLAITDISGILTKNLEINAIRNQIKALDDLGKAEKQAQAAKISKMELGDLKIDEEELGVLEKKKSILEEQKDFEADFTEWLKNEQQKRLDNEAAIIETQKQLFYARVEAVQSGLDLIGALSKESAIAQQVIAISQAIINGALAVTKIQAQGGILAPPLIVASILTTLAQIATIRQQKFEKGGFDVLKGRRHAQGGVDIGIGEAEAGEGLAVFNRTATQKYGKFLPAFVKAINENNGDLGYSDGAYMISFDDSKSVNELKQINKHLNKPDIRYEKGYRIETRKGQTTRVKI